MDPSAPTLVTSFATVGFAIQAQAIGRHAAVACGGSGVQVLEVFAETSRVPVAGPGAQLGAAPNPFNPRTTIRFALQEASHVRLSVHDLAGRLVRTLLDGGLPAGAQQVTWDGRDAAGRAVGSGSYLARLEAGGMVEMVPMMLVR